MPSEAQYDALRSLIENHRDVCHFGEYGELCSEQLLTLAEQRLGLRLPPSYRWWCRHYGGGELGPYELASVYSESPDDSCPGMDIAYMALVNRRNGLHGTELLELLNYEGDEVYYFDTRDADAEGEYPVVVMNEMGEFAPYAPSFLEFLKKQVEFLSQA